MDVLAMEPPLGGQTVVYSNRQVSECLRLPNRGKTLGSTAPVHPCILSLRMER